MARFGTAEQQAALLPGVVAGTTLLTAALVEPLGDLERHAARFVVCDVDGELMACAELAPLSATVAEVRSLVVSLVSNLAAAARHSGSNRVPEAAPRSGEPGGAGDAWRRPSGLGR